MLWLLLFVNIFLTSCYATNDHQKRLFRTCHSYEDFSSQQSAITKDKLNYLVLSTNSFSNQCYKCYPVDTGSSAYLNCHKNGIIVSDITMNIRYPKIVKYVPGQYVILYTCSKQILGILDEDIYVLSANDKLSPDQDTEIKKIISDMRVLFGFVKDTRRGCN